jgi:hypothetical protein
LHPPSPASSRGSADPSAHPKSFSWQSMRQTGHEDTPGRATDRRSGRPVLWAGYLTLALLFLALSGIRPFLVDDTFITFAYARNLAEHGVLTWHVALPMVDGFTSLGHVLLLAGGVVAGLDIVLANTLVNFGAAVVIAGLYAWRVRGLPAPAAVAGFAAIALNAGFVFWVGGGLDALPYAAAFFVAYHCFERAEQAGRLDAATALALVALAVMRPEGALIAAGLLAFFWARALLGRERAGLVWTVAVVAAIAAMLIWRVETYGHPFPNTYYAKASSSTWLEVRYGLGYLAGWCALGGGFLALVSVGAVLGGSGAWLRLLFILGQCALVAAEGGDSHPVYRFMLPVIPLIALDVAWVFARAGVRWRLAGGVGLALYLAVQNLGNPGGPYPAGAAAGLARIADGTWPFATIEDDRLNYRRVEASRRFGALFRDGTEIAANDLGALAYYSELPVLDINGLNHPEISHLPKVDGVVNIWGAPRLDVLIAEEVPVVHLWFPNVESWSWRGVAEGDVDCGLNVGRKAMAMGYELVGLEAHYLCVSAPAGEGGWLNFFVRRGALEAVLRDPAAVEATECVMPIRRACGY